MPKNPPRNNPKNRAARTVQSAASVLRRISQKTGVALPPLPGPAAAPSHIDVIRASLPLQLRAHLVTCLLRPGELVLFAEAAVWATRLRVAAAEAHARGDFANLGVKVERITVRISPRTATR